MAVEQVSVEDFYNWFQNKPQNTVDTPYEVEITGVSVNNWYMIKNYLDSIGDVGKYLDLRPSTVPLSVFENIQVMVYAPAFDSTTYAPSVDGWFQNCTNLKESPVFPSKITSFRNMFEGCTSLQTVNVSQNMIDSERYSDIFKGCTSLTNFNTDRPYECKSWLSQIHSESTDNFPNDPDNCYYIPYSTAEIPFSLLNDYLSSLPANTVQTPYKLNVTGLTANDVERSMTSGTLGYILKQNNTKYLDLRETILPNNLVTYLNMTFNGCVTLLYSPAIPTNEELTYLNCTFLGCSNLKEAPIIPDNINTLWCTFEDCRALTTVPYLSTNLTCGRQAFQNCPSLTSVPDAPNVTDSQMMFQGCSSLTRQPIVKRLGDFTYAGCAFSRATITTEMMYVQSLNATFLNCVNLDFDEPLIIPDNVEEMINTFYGCTSLTVPPVLPEKRNLVLGGTFCVCTSLRVMPHIPKNVTSLYGGINSNPTGCFQACSSLEEITLFEADLESLVSNNKAQNCFFGCTSLTKIGLPQTPDSDPVESDWHAFRLKFDATTVQGKVYDQTGTAVTIPQTSITKSTLKLPIKTDELWFPNGYTDAQIDEIIQKVIQYRYTYWNDTDVLDPAKKNFVLWADDPDNVKTNVIPDIDYPIAIDKGGTGRTTTASGAMYATSANGALQMGTLPVAQGGTGKTSLANVNVGSSDVASQLNAVAKQNDVSAIYRYEGSWGATSSYQTGGNEALVFATKNAVTSFMFVNGEDSIANHGSSRWYSLTPAIQIKNGKVTINKLIGNDVTPAYNLEVNGDVKADIYKLNDQNVMAYKDTTFNGFKIHDNQTNALYIEGREATSSDSGGIAITNDGVSAFGAGDTDGVFRVVNEDNVGAGAVFKVMKTGATYGNFILPSSNIGVNGAIWIE